MHDFPVMTVLESEANLSEVVEYFLFCEWWAILLALLDLLCKLTIVSVLHDEVEKQVIVLEDVLELDDVRMIKNFQYLRLLSRRNTLLIR